MHGYIVTAACRIDDVIVGLYDNIEDAKTRQQEVLAASADDERWPSKHYGECSELSGDEYQTASDAICIRIIEASGTDVRMVSSESIEDYVEQQETKSAI